jgi:hypothetical protein
MLNLIILGRLSRKSYELPRKMPIITVETNLSYTQFPENFGTELSKFTSETLDKPEEVKIYYLILSPIRPIQSTNKVVIYNFSELPSVW